LTFVDVKGNPQYFRHLIGRDGSTIGKIKQETGVQITVCLSLYHYFDLFIYFSQMPPNDGVSDQIRIEGSADGVKKAKAAIEAILKKLADSKVVLLLLVVTHARDPNLIRISK
jgi:hypothetical protein